MNVFKLTQGCDRSIDLTLYDPVGNPITAYSTGDVLSSKVWRGGSQPVLFNPSVDWIAASLGTYRLSFKASDVASLAPGRYFVDVQIVTVANRTIDALDAQIEVMAAPGVSQPLSTYATFSDALPYAPWLSTAIGDQDTGDLNVHFHNARTWLEGIIQAKYRTYYGNQNWGYSIFGRPFPFDWLQQGDSPWLQQLLDANKLLVRPRVIEITAKRALGTLLKSRIAPTEGESNYQRLAYGFLAEADSLVLSLTAEIDTNGDQITDLAVPCGISSIR
jgi:hypothetical protein